MYIKELKSPGAQEGWPSSQDRSILQGQHPRQVFYVRTGVDAGKDVMSPFSEHLP